MRVCLVSRRFYECNTHMQQFANALASRGDIVDVIAARRRGSPAYEVCNGVNIFRIQYRDVDECGRFVYLFKILQFLIRAAMCIAARHLRSGYDLIHVQPIPDVLVFSALIPKLSGVPVILDLRDLVPELWGSKFNVADKSVLFKLLRLAERCSVAFANHVIVANPIWYERVVSRSAERSKCSMIWYSPDPTVFHTGSRLHINGRFVIMYPGTLSWHQGVDILIRAFPKIRAAIPQAEVHIYAEGTARKALEDLTELLCLGKAIQFFDIVPTAVLVDRMANCDVAVVPKRASDSFGNEAASTKISEFMAVGVPVVASRTEIESRFFDDSELCYFRSEDEEDLVRAVVTVHSDPELTARLSANATEKIRNGAHDLRQQYLELVDCLVAQKRGRSHQPQVSARTVR